MNDYAIEYERYIWKQWKRVRTRYKMLRELHLPEWKAEEMANC